MSQKPRGLGRGLSALMADVAQQAGGDAQRAERLIPLDSLRPNPNQPRRSFPAAAMAELVASIREKGIIQPILVRPDPTDPTRYQIIAGERRWRAAQEAGLTDVPIIQRSYSDAETLEIALIENIQRSDLNPIDEAAAYRQLMERHSQSQDQLATALGKSRSHVANQIRLLSLPEEVQTMVVEGNLSAGHARALIGHPQVVALARHVARNRLSVRQTEALARKPFTPADPMTATNRPVPKDPDTVHLEDEVSATLGMRVTIEQGGDGEAGRLVIRYKRLEQLDNLLRMLTGQ